MKSNKNKNSLFLMELMSAIFFFSLISAICIQVFTQAHLLSKNSEALDRAMILSQNAAECIKKAEDGTVAILGEYFDGTRINDQEFEAYYKEDFSPAKTQEESFYYLRVVLTTPKGSAAHYLAGEISFLKTEDHSNVFRLQVEKYLF